MLKINSHFPFGAITPRAFAGEYIGGERLLPRILMNVPAPLAAAVALITLSASIICEFSSFPFVAFVRSAGEKSTPHCRVAGKDGVSSLQAESRRGGLVA